MFIDDTAEFISQKTAALIRVIYQEVKLCFFETTGNLIHDIAFQKQSPGGVM